MTEADITHVVMEHATAASPAVAVGFDGLCILSGGFNHGSAEQPRREKRGDLVVQMRVDAPLNAADIATFDVPGARGYIGYPTLAI